MNTIKFNRRRYKYESFWRDNKDIKITDSEENILPYPTERKTKWQNQEFFVEKLEEIENHLRRKNKFIKYEQERFKDCLICGQKNVSTGLFEINNIRWENGLLHYINRHNVKPSDRFIDTIFRHTVGPKIRKIKRLTTMKGVKVKKFNKMYLKIDRNQINIMDALMKHGSSRQYVDKKDNTFLRYSEHAGLLDFNDDGLEKIIISGNTTRVDEHDDDIFFPQNMIDAFDYEYIFHTHPATPKPGGRVREGVLYEFPSISDLFHFMDHYNMGSTQGSIIIAAEGMYNIRKFKYDNEPIKINENKFFQEIKEVYIELQIDAIDEYGTEFSTSDFYSEIAQDKTYINKLNEKLNKYKLHIDYFPRVQDVSKRWIIDTVYLPVHVVEPA